MKQLETLKRRKMIAGMTGVIPVLGRPTDLLKCR